MFGQCFRALSDMVQLLKKDLRGVYFCVLDCP